MKKTRNKGFTIVEMVIAIAIALVAMALIGAFSALISTYVKEKNIVTNVNEDMATVRRVVDNWLNDYDSAEYSNPIVNGTNSVTVSSASVISTLSYDLPTKTISITTTNTVDGTSTTITDTTSLRVAYSLTFTQPLDAKYFVVEVNFIDDASVHRLFFTLRT